MSGMREIARALGAIVAILAAPGQVYAQRAGENAVTNADDAFGTNIGMESSGIYTEFDTRGFSPTKAGNIRIDGIYFDPAFVLAGRLRESTAIRVGFSAEEYPFHAPTGIVDHKFRGFPDELGASAAFHSTAHWGHIVELDLRVPVIADRLSLTGGYAGSDSRMVDGSGNHGYGLTIRPILRFGGVEIAPFASKGGFRNQIARALTVVNGSELPALPAVRRYLGQTWAKGEMKNQNSGITVKAALTGGLSLRAGLFYAAAPRPVNFTELYALSGSSGLASHRLIADPRQDVHSTSGEVQLALRLERGRWQHRFIAGFRARKRYTESGGSAVRSYPELVPYGEPDPRPEESFAFGPVNQGRLTQSSIMLGYTGKLDGIGRLNLGIQKARYRGTSRDGRTGAVTRSDDDTWLYNATLGIDISSALSVYFGTEKGLEDSGAAPESALNRNEQLPATRTTQYEGGVRWKFNGGQLVVNAFQITKPYFTGNPGEAFVQQGAVRHRGIETSLSGKFGKRLSLVAGALVMQPRVAGGLRPVGTPSLFVRADANYRTDIFGGLTPTVSIIHTGERAVSSRGLAALGGKQLMQPSHTSIDLGLRQQFRIGSIPASVRAVVVDVLDKPSWKVVAANTLYPEERRRLNVSLTADF